MPSVRTSITTLMIGTGLLFLGYGLLITLLPIRAQMEGFSTTMIGVLGGAYFAGFGVGCILGPKVIKQVGHIRAFAGFAAIGASIVLVHPLAIDPGVWAALRALTGLCMAVLIMVIESWLNEQSSNENRGQILSIYVIVTNIVTMGGQLTVNTYDPAGPALFTLAAIMLCLCLVPLVLTATAAPKPIAEATLKIRDLYGHSPSGFIGCVAFGLADGAFWSLGPVFAQGRGFNIADTTFVMSLFVVGGTISQWPLGRLSDKIDRRWVILGLCVGAVATAGALAWFEFDERLYVYFLAALHGACLIPLYPLLLAHTNDYAPTEKLVETSSGLLLLYAMGAVAGPFLAAPLMHAFGDGSLFFFIAAVLGPFGLYVLYRTTCRGEAKAEERVEFYPVPSTTPAIYSLETDD